MRFQSQQIGPIVIDRAYNLFKYSKMFFVCILLRLVWVGKNRPLDGEGIVLE